MQSKGTQINDLVNQVCDDPSKSEILGSSQLRDFLLDGVSQLINQWMVTDRNIHLNSTPGDSGNGFTPNRTVKLGTSPVQLSLPRTRSGQYYPSFLDKYNRVIPGDYESILMNILLEAKNFASVSRQVRALGLPYRPDELDTLINETYEQAKQLFSKRLACDWNFIYIDAKCIDMINENNRIDQAVIFTVVGVNTDCKKEILGIYHFWGNECIDFWKNVLNDLKKRGVTRVLTLITDDFSGLTPVIKSMFENSDHQLCHVHLLRNALRRFPKDDYAQFKQKLDDIHSAADFESARSRFMDLVTSIQTDYPDYAKHLRKRADQFCAFAKFSAGLRAHIRSTNPVEGINNRIEIIRRCAGGLFHSERELFVKLKIMTDSFHSKKWKNPIPKIKAHINELSRLFYLKFEAES